MKRSRRDFRWALTVDSPWACGVNRISIGFQPCANLQQHLLHFSWYGPVGAGTDIQKQIAVLADDIDQLVDDELRRLESIVLDIPPGFVADGRVCLPIE